jgi:hypothetical protein
MVIKSLDPKSSHLTIKANMYSKSMTITTTRTSILCHAIQIILSVFYMHMSFTSPTLLAYLAQRFFSKC